MLLLDMFHGGREISYWSQDSGWVGLYKGRSLTVGARMWGSYLAPAINWAWMRPPQFLHLGNEEVIVYCNLLRAFQSTCPGLWSLSRKGGGKRCYFAIVCTSNGICFGIQIYRNLVQTSVWSTEVKFLGYHWGWWSFNGLKYKLGREGSIITSNG